MVDSISYVQAEKTNVRQRYQRNLRGYGKQSPNPKWPGRAYIAVQVVVNYEEGGENCLLHGDNTSEAFLSEIIGASTWEGQRHWNMESIYEYGARVGFWRVRKILDEAEVPVTVFGVATALARSPEQTLAMQQSGWEIASHGLKWIEYKDYTKEEERQHVQEAIRLHKEVTGERPLGWYTGRCSMNTASLVAESGNFAYLADSYADELPYWQNISGKNQLIVPYTLDVNDMRFATSQGFNAGDQFYSYLKDSFDILYKEGQNGAPKMMSIGLHCRLAGRPGRVQAFKRFLEYAKNHSGVWFAKRIEIAEHWIKHHPIPLNPIQVSSMDRREFVQQFGSVFEHSAWIAERAYQLEIGAAHNCLEGMHNLLCRVFRSASKEERMGVIKSHPDLAGKLAQAKLLTATSTIEQASVGLDVLTDKEKSMFEKLNRCYRERFEIPFIIAVRDHTRQSILETFKQRVENNPDDEYIEACRQIERIAWYRLIPFFDEG